MGTITVAGKTVEEDEEGCLVNRSDWNEEVAREMARTDGTKLTPDHWKVIHFLRAYYDEYQTSPAARVLAKAIGKKLGPGKGTVSYLLELFPEGATRQMCKYAGLPKPGCSGE